jgi:hypothetical protein
MKPYSWHISTHHLLIVEPSVTSDCWVSSHKHLHSLECSVPILSPLLVPGVSKSPMAGPQVSHGCATSLPYGQATSLSWPRATSLPWPGHKYVPLCGVSTRVDRCMGTKHWLLCWARFIHGWVTSICMNLEPGLAFILSSLNTWCSYNILHWQHAEDLPQKLRPHSHLRTLKLCESFLQQLNVAIAFASKVFCGAGP